MADRDGRLEYRPKRIKAEVLPYDECDIEKLLGQLADKSFLQLYCVNNQYYVEILNFRKHQNCHIKEAASTIPAPDEHQTSTRRAPDEHGASPSDSLLLIPDSGFPLTDSPLLKPEKAARPPIPYREIVEYLNLKTGKNFDPDAKETRAQIKARWGPKRSLEDFKTVIENKCADWGTNPEMVNYLRPETLFGRKFESYLNEKPHHMRGVVKNIATVQMLDEWRPPA